MTFVWDVINNTEPDMFGTLLYNCRVGDLCFDVFGRGNEGFFELCCGGVDTGCGVSFADYMKDYPGVSKYDIPDEFGYPYDRVGRGDFPAGFDKLPIEEFRKRAEEIFADYIMTAKYDNVNLVAKANEPLHIW